jgi:nucleoside-diphosphate-sugar epimerase
MSGTRKTMLITGSSGFIGKNLAAYFTDRYDVLSPRHRDLDVLDREAVDLFFRDHAIDYVINCASVGGSRKSLDMPNVVSKNLMMFFNLAENDRYFEKMIHLGSGAEYDKTTMPPNVKEEQFGRATPHDDYGFSKYVISKYIAQSANVYCLRLFGIFGPYEDYEYKFISNTIVKNLLCLPIVIKQNVFFDWLYVRDFEKILDFFLSKTPTEKMYNVTSGKTIDLLSIAQIINSVSDYRSDIIVENEGLNREYSGDNSRLINEIGAFEFTSTEQAIRDLFTYYRGILATINRSAIEEDEYAEYCQLNICTD